MADNVFDKHFGQNPENPEGMRATEQRSVSLKQDAREPRLAMEADVTTTLRLTSVWRALKQIKRRMGIAALQKGSKSA